MTLLAVSVLGPSGVAHGAIPADRGLADLNALRAVAGQLPVAFDDGLNDACDAHNGYRERNPGQSNPHDEAPGSPGYSEAGRTAARTSVLSTGEFLPTPAWVDAPFHRASILQPRLRLTGYAASHGFTCLKIFGTTQDGRPVIDDSPAARSAELALAPWPPDGVRDVAVAGIGPRLESPDPYDVLPQSVQRAGPMITVGVNGPWASSFDPSAQVTSATVTPEAGQPVGLTVCDERCKFGENLDGGFGLFVHQPLGDATWHTVAAKGVVRAKGREYPFEARWRFQTERPSPVTRLALRGRALVAKTRSPQPIDVVLRRLPSGPTEALSMAPGAKRTLTPGRWRVCFTQAEDERWLGVRTSVCGNRLIKAPVKLRLSSGKRIGKRVRFVLTTGRYGVGRRAVVRASRRGAARKIVLRKRQTLTFRAPARGERLRIEVRLPAIVRRDGTPIAAGAAVRTFR